MRPIVWTAHAEQAIASRKIRKDWVEDAIRHPDWQDLDPANANRTRYYRVVPELRDRVIRVVCEVSDEYVSVITVFPDRKALSKKRVP